MKKKLKKYDTVTNVNVVTNGMMMILVTGTWDCYTIGVVFVVLLY